MKERLKLLSSPLFITGLLLLILNDHFFKSAWPGFVTGKLSDIAGLFIFPIFFTVFFPRYIKQIYLLTLVGFTWWKSPFSEVVIQAFNQLQLMPVQRMVDYTDLLALTILPFSYLYVLKEKQRPLHRWVHPMPVIILTAFAFVATSRGPKASIKFNKEYSFQYPIDTLEKRLFFNADINNYALEEWKKLDEQLHDSSRVSLPKHIERKKQELFNNFIHTTMYLNLYDKDHQLDCQHMEMIVDLVPNRKLSTLKLKSISYRNCKHDTAEPDSVQLIRIFENKVIAPLQAP